jgi:L-threonylcarbamoyladenylate synthase
VSQPDPASQALHAAVTVLRAGELIVYPTETFYGIGARALGAAAVASLARLKERGGEGGKPISVIVADRAMVARVVARVPERAEALMDHFWPGPLTLVLPARDDLPPELTAGSGRIAVRVSSHPVARALAAALGEPITATSANHAGEAAACDVAAARRALGAAIAVYVDGGVLAGGSGSTVLVVDDDAAHVVRAGAVSVAALRRVLGGVPLAAPS